MSRKSLLLLVLIVVLPIMTFAWLGWRVASAEEARVQQAYRQLLTERLDQHSARLGQYFEEQRRILGRQVQSVGDKARSIRDFVRSTPLVHQAIIVDRQGDIVHPATLTAASDSEVQFVGEIEQLLLDKDVVRIAFGKPSQSNLAATPVNRPDSNAVTLVPVDPSQVPMDVLVLSQDSDNQSPTLIASSAAETQRSVVQPTQDMTARLPPTGQLAQATSVGEGAVTDGWYVWYWGRGLHLIYWNRWSDDRVTLTALSRPRWISDLLALLPETPSQPDATASNWRITLCDSADDVVYQWGGLEPVEGSLPLAERSVHAPLTAWRLKHFVDQSARRSYSRLPIVAGLASMAVGLLGLTLVLYREYSREMREAGQRVSFVNQVSHELKTPLTNIRMYADLLELDLENLPTDQGQKPQGRLAVIVSESQRLSRLIANVLTFARAERDALTIRPRKTDVDALIQHVVERFAPTLNELQIATDVEGGLSGEHDVDPDAVEQIVGNLISNVIRYAADGRWLQIRTRSTDTALQIFVADHGPGIPASARHKVFQPFFRASDRLSDVAGTGIGLSIARQLARAHGGDVTLIDAEQGTEFCVTLATQPPYSRSSSTS